MFLVNLIRHLNCIFVDFSHFFDAFSRLTVFLHTEVLLFRQILRHLHHSLVAHSPILSISVKDEPIVLSLRLHLLVSSRRNLFKTSLLHKLKLLHFG